MIQGLRSAFGDSLSYLGKDGIGSPQQQSSPRLSKSLPLATPTHSPSSIPSPDRYNSQSFHSPGTKNRFGTTTGAAHTGSENGYGPQSHS